MSNPHYSILRAIKCQDLKLFNDLVNGASLKYINYINPSINHNLLQYICRIRPFDNEIYISMIDLLVRYLFYLFL